MNSPEARRAPRAVRRAVAPLAAAAVVALVGGACAESPIAGRRPTPDAPVPLAPLTADGVRATLALVDSAVGTATVVVALDARGLDVGAYQGRVEYDPAALELASAESVRPAAAGGSRYVNAAAGGGTAAVVRFAGFSATGPVAARGGDAVARLVFRVRDWRAVDALRVTLEAAGQTDGRAVAGARLMTGARVVSALGRAP